jgi:hypothetical protein
MTHYDRPSPYIVRMTTTLPPMIAIMSLRTELAAIFDTTLIPDHPTQPTYLITPHRFYQKYSLPSFMIPDRPANHTMPNVTLLNADHHVIFNGECHPTECSIYSTYHPAPIPVMVFEGGRINWPKNNDNILRIFPGDRAAYRFWLRRWDPDAVFEEYSANRREPNATPSPSPPSSTTSPPPSTTSPTITTIPQFVADALITAAVTKEAICPITMEPITTETASVTPCYHIFDATALASWIASGNTTCPTCKHQLP